MIKTVHAIFVPTDAKFAEFTLEDWYESLKAHSDLSALSVNVLDYGMTPRQVQEFERKRINVVPCQRDGHVNILRWRDIAKACLKNNYDQVMTTDGGDLIFQDDVNDLFDHDKNLIRAATEDLGVPFQEVFAKNKFSRENAHKIRTLLLGKRMINAGVILGPAKKIIELGEKISEIITDKSSFGPDQVAVNYILYQGGFKEISEKYNFVIASSSVGFTVKNSVFYFKSGEKIGIVHNAGEVSWKRPIRNFGYGPGKNQVKMLTYFLIRLWLRIGVFYFGVMRKWKTGLSTAR